MMFVFLSSDILLWITFLFSRKEKKVYTKSVTQASELHCNPAIRYFSHQTGVCRYLFRAISLRAISSLTIIHVTIDIHVVSNHMA